MTRRAIAPTAVLFLLGVTTDLFIGYSPVPGYGAAIGLLGCITIVLVSKWLGEHALKRPERYYPTEVPPDLQPDLLPTEHPEHQPHARRGAR